MATPEELEYERDVLKSMRKVSQAFYLGAISAGCHAFIEFTGLMNEFIRCCSEAHERGESFLHANVHSGRHLALERHQEQYIAEKLSCIYGITSFRP